MRYNVQFEIERLVDECASGERHSGNEKDEAWSEGAVESVVIIFWSMSDHYPPTPTHLTVISARIAPPFLPTLGKAHASIIKIPRPIISHWEST